MGFKNAHLLVLFLTAASMAAFAKANKNITSPDWRWDSGSNFTNWWSKHLNATTGGSNGPKRIVVGGSENWHFGFNYTDWAIKNSPFYVNDILVFKYVAPKGPNDHPHSVYLFSDYMSWSKCDLKKARRVANPKQGGGKGFEVVLKKWKPYFFACGESKGIHCNLGMMKFPVMPMLRRWY